MGAGPDWRVRTATTSPATRTGTQSTIRWKSSPGRRICSVTTSSSPIVQRSRRATLWRPRVRPAMARRSSEAVSESARAPTGSTGYTVGPVVQRTWARAMKVSSAGASAASLQGAYTSRSENDRSASRAHAPTRRWRWSTARSSRGVRAPASSARLAMGAGRRQPNPMGLESVGMTST